MSNGDSPYRNLERIVAGQQAPPLLLILAPDTVRRERAVQHVLKAFVPQKSGGVAVRRLNARELRLAEFAALLTDLSSPSLFTRQQFFVVRDLHAISAAVMKQLAAALPDLPEDSTLLLSGEKLAKSSALYKYCKGRGVLVEFEKLAGAEYQRWIQSELKRAGMKDYPANVPELIASISSGSADAAMQMIDKLALFAADGSVTGEEFAQLYTEVPHPIEFELLEAVQAANPARAEALLQQLIDSGSNLFALLGLLSKSFGQYLAVRSLLDRGLPPAQVRQELHMSPWVFKKALAAARRYSTAELVQRQSCILGADSRLKNRSVGPDSVMSDLLSRLAPNRLKKSAN